MRSILFSLGFLWMTSGCVRPSVNEPAGVETGKQTVEKIFLHWSASGYNYTEPGHYHTIVQGDGTVKHIHPYSVGLSAHTARRNTNSAAIAVACMRNDWETPCKDVQIEAMAKEAASLAHSLGWTEADITPQKVMTHAEAAALRDFPLAKVKKSGAALAYGDVDADAVAAGMPHSNYGPSSWFDGWPGGTVERWDLWILKENGEKGKGGYILREKIKKYLNEMNGTTAQTNTDRNPENPDPQGTTDTRTSIDPNYR